MGSCLWMFIGCSSELPFTLDGDATSGTGYDEMSSVQDFVRGYFAEEQDVVHVRVCPQAGCERGEVYVGCCSHWELTRIVDFLRLTVTSMVRRPGRSEPHHWRRTSTQLEARRVPSAPSHTILLAPQPHSSRVPTGPTVRPRRSFTPPTFSAVPGYHVPRKPLTGYFDLATLPTDIARAFPDRSALLPTGAFKGREMAR